MESDYPNISLCTELNESWITTEFYLVVLFGTSVAVLSTAENVVLFYILTTQKKFRSSNLFYMTWIAFFDIFIGISFVLLLTVKVLHDYLPSVILHKIWHSYFCEVFTVCHVSLAASTFLIISATAERFLSIQNPALCRFAERNRLPIAILSFLLGLSLKGTIYLEYTILVDENCWNRARYRAAPSDLSLHNWYFKTIWQFYARHIFLVFVPFIVLMYMNIQIVISLRKQTSDTSGRINGEDVRIATRMMVLIVTIYLLTNVLNLVITAWEHVDKESLDSPAFTTFHVFSADTTTILTVAAGASRLPIYAWLNHQIAAELKRMVCCCWFGQGRKNGCHPGLSESSRCKYGTPCNTPEVGRTTCQDYEGPHGFIPTSFSDSAVVLVDSGVKSELVTHYWNKRNRTGNPQPPEDCCSCDE